MSSYPDKLIVTGDLDPDVTGIYTKDPESPFPETPQYFHETEREDGKRYTIRMSSDPFGTPTEYRIYDNQSTVSVSYFTSDPPLTDTVIGSYPVNSGNSTGTAIVAEYIEPQPEPEIELQISPFDAAQIAAAPSMLAQFGEQVKYCPAEGDEREITAIVNRDGYQSLQGAPHGAAAKFTVSVLNDSEKGISSAEIDTGTDLIEIAQRMGTQAKKRRIISVVGHDAAWMELEVQ